MVRHSPVAGNRSRPRRLAIFVLVAKEQEAILRYARTSRWFHAGMYVTVLVLLATGWWFVLVGYSSRSPLARVAGMPDGAMHELAGQASVVVFLLWLPFGFRRIGWFVRESLRFRRGDGRWLVGLPRAAFTGRFGDHDGHFDPGQRLANIAIVITLGVLTLSGLGMLYLPPGPLDLFVLHRWAAFLVTPVLLGHIVVSAGVLPGYRGVWRSMHLGGRLPVEVARRIWPSWLERHRR
jgi:formate dehydrogenase subunit gamma